MVEASAGGAVAANLAHALGGRQRRFVIAASAWEADTARVRSLLLEHGAAAVVAPNLALGAALFLRLAERAAEMYSRVAGSSPRSWSGTDAARRTVRRARRATSPAGSRRSTPAGPDPTSMTITAPALEVVGIRAGADARHRTS